MFPTKIQKQNMYRFIKKKTYTQKQICYPSLKYSIVL